MNSAFSDAQVKQVSAQLGPLGDPKTFTFTDSQVIEGITVYRYRTTFASGAAVWILALDSDGKIAGLFLRRAQ